MKSAPQLSCLIALIGYSACASEPTRPSLPTASKDAAWLMTGTNDEKIERIAKHLRGFDVAMVEVGYRYSELYWAGHDRNWEYAEYQARKIATAIENGLERRPARAASARMIDGPLATVHLALKDQDAARFASAFDTLTATCNACHEAERVAFVHIERPTARTTAVRAPAKEETK